MILPVTLLLAFVASLNANCDNNCSGHGTCMIDEVCSCYDNWGVGLNHDSGDCSDRICPFQLAWVDTPDALGAFHKYAECAGRGICNRATGECGCFDGYDGKSCQRTTCPNDCSGHGTCEYIENMTFFGHPSSTVFRGGASLENISRIYKLRKLWHKLCKDLRCAVAHPHFKKRPAGSLTSVTTLNQQKVVNIFPSSMVLLDWVKVVERFAERFESEFSTCSKKVSGVS